MLAAAVYTAALPHSSERGSSCSSMAISVLCPAVQCVRQEKECSSRLERMDFSCMHFFHTLLQLAAQYSVWGKGREAAAADWKGRISAAFFPCTSEAGWAWKVFCCFSSCENGSHSWFHVPPAENFSWPASCRSAWKKCSWNSFFPICCCCFPSLASHTAQQGTEQIWPCWNKMTPLSLVLLSVGKHCCVHSGTAAHCCCRFRDESTAVP